MGTVFIQKEYINNYDETHFLTRCPKFSGERDDLFNSISAKVKNFTNLSDKNKLFWLLNCEYQEILNSVGRFLYQHMPSCEFICVILVYV